MTHRACYWNATAPALDLPELAGEIEADVAIIGGGIVGIVAARLLTDRGHRVALTEARKVGEGVTGRSTAKVTSQHNLALARIARKFGEDGARLYAEANQAGLGLIRALAARHGIECGLQDKAAFTYTKDEERVAEIEEEVALAQRLGLPATLRRDTGLPFAVAAAMRWDGQAQFHPVQFVKGLAATLAGNGCRVFENSPVVDWAPDRVETAKGGIRARHVVMATHLPIGNTGLFFAEAYPHMHPVIMGPADAVRVPDGMYISVETPRHSTRGHVDQAERSWMIFTGPSFKGGHVEEERAAFAEIERFARERFGVEAAYRWTNEDYSAMDQVPFVGRASSGESCLVATGFGAWGITNGAAAATMIADLIDGRDNAWLELFDARRVKPLAGGPAFVKGNAEVAGELVSGWLSRKLHSLDELARGEAAILRIGGENVAAYRDEEGRVHAVSAVCTHLGCLLGWNETDRTWDCPCHGSRFDLDGSVVHGPAVTPLAVKRPASGEADQAMRSA